MTMELNARPRAVADVSEGMILATVDIAAPPDRVFRALASEEIVKWWGSAELYRVTKWTGDVKPGGSWRADGIGADGTLFSVQGEFLEVEPPTRLVMTWRADWDGGNVTTIVYRLETLARGTRLVLRHTGFADRTESCRGHANGWERVLGWLVGYLEPEKATP